MKKIIVVLAIITIVISIKLQHIESLNNTIEDKNYSWVTGYSSPWVSSYEIIYDKKKQDNIYNVIVKFNWETSSGSYNSSEINLLIKEENGNWCITSIENKY